MDIERLCEKFQLTENERSILYYIDQSRDKEKLGIREVAQKNYASPSSIVAMCKKMGLSGYSELLYYMIGAKNLTFSLQQNKVIEQYGNQFRELLRKHKENRIMILSSGMSTHIANYMSDSLNLNGFRATSTSHLQLLRPTNCENSFVWFVSNSGETKRLVELAEISQQNGLDSISFVGNADSLLFHTTTLSITTSTNSAYSYQDYYPQLFFGYCLNAFEMLMSYTLSTTSKFTI